MQKIAAFFSLLYVLWFSTVFASVSTVFNSIILVPSHQDAPYFDCLHQWLDPLIGSKLDNSDLQLLRQRINNQCFYQLGFSNSGIVYPDQNFIDDKLYIEVIEGQINSIKIKGSQSLPQSWYQTQLQTALQQPFQIARLREALLILEQHPLIEKINAQLMPSNELGKGVLVLQVEEKLPYQLKIDLNNVQFSPSVGDVFFNMSAKHLSLTGNADELGLDLSFAEGLKQIFVNYRFPLDPKFWLTFDLLVAHSKVVEQPFAQLNITNTLGRASIGFQYALMRSLNQQLYLHSSFIMERSHSQLLGESFSFSSGVNQGEARLSILELGLQWGGRVSHQRSMDQSWYINSQLQIGLPIFSSTRNEGDSEADGEFVKWRMQSQWRKRLSQDGQFQLLIAANAQWSNKPLLPLEIYSVGGINSVRGYRQSLFSRDIGWTTSLNLPVRLMPGLEIAPFVDTGQAWDYKYDQQKTLVSIGLALDWQMISGWWINTYYAAALTEKVKLGNSLQDNGFGFRIQYRFL